MYVYKRNSILFCHSQPFTRLARLLDMVNVRLVKSIVESGGVEIAQRLILQGTSGPGADSISFPAGQDCLGKYVPGQIFLVDRFSSDIGIKMK